MIGWTEGKEGYHVEVRRGGPGVAYGAVVAAFVLTGLILASMFLFGRAPVTTTERVKWALGFLFACLGLAGLCAAQGRVYWRERGWAEVGIRDGRARWEGVSWVEVVLFELARGPEGEQSVHALLRDGRRARVLGPWRTYTDQAIEQLVADFNANLGTLESSRATLGSPTVRLDPSLTDGELAAVNAWAAADGPYWLETRAYPGVARIAPFTLFPAVYALLKRTAISVPSAVWLVAGSSILLVVCLWVLTRKRWIEVQSRGGLVLWGRGDSTLSPKPIRVASFDTELMREPLAGREYRILVANLPDGERVYPFDLTPIESRRACVFAVMLNAVLRTGSTPTQDSAAEGRMAR